MKEKIRPIFLRMNYINLCIVLHKYKNLTPVINFINDPGNMEAKSSILKKFPSFKKKKKTYNKKYIEQLKKAN